MPDGECVVGQPEGLVHQAWDGWDGWDETWDGWDGWDGVVGVAGVNPGVTWVCRGASPDETQQKSRKLWARADGE